MLSLLSRVAYFIREMPDSWIYSRNCGLQLVKSHEEHVFQHYIWHYTIIKNVLAESLYLVLWWRSDDNSRQNTCFYLTFYIFSIYDLEHLDSFKNAFRNRNREESIQMQFTKISKSSLNCRYLTNNKLEHARHKTRAS